MRVLICGSRDWDKWSPIAERLIRLRQENEPDDVTVISGGATGADSIAAHQAKGAGCDVIVVYPNWRRYGSAAGVRRNCIMLDMEPDLVIAFWDGKSPGTKHTIAEARRRGIPVEIVS